MQGKRVINAAKLAALRRKGSLKETKTPTTPPVPAPAGPPSAKGALATGPRRVPGKAGFDPYRPVVMSAHKTGVAVEKPSAPLPPSTPSGTQPAQPVARQPFYRRPFAYVVRRAPPPPPPSRPKWPSMLASGIALGLVIALFTTPVGEVFFDIYRHPFYDQFPETAQITVQRTLTMSMQSGTGNFDVDLARPVEIKLIDSGEEKFVQRFNKIETVPPPSDETPKSGPDGPWPWMTWHLSGVTSTSVNILYDVETRTVRWDLSPADAGTVEQIPAQLVDQYIKNPTGGKEWRGATNGRYKIDPQNVVLAAKALDVSKDKSTALEKAQAIYFFLQGTYKYAQGDTGSEPRDALAVYEDGRGDCDEVSFLFISMLRAVGIPAWPEFGILYDSLQERWVGHAWVKLYLPDKNGGGYEANADPVNYQWLFRSANRITEWESDGNEQHLVDFYNIISYSGTGTPSITDKWTGIKFESQGVVFNQDTSREIKYVDAPSGFEVIAAVGAAMLLMMVVARRRSRSSR